MAARDEIGDVDDHLLLAADGLTVDRPPTEVWDLVEGEQQSALLRLVSDRFVERLVTEALDDGYRCRTVSRRLLRRRSFESVVLLERPQRSVELQVGDRTDLLYVTHYLPEGDGTRVELEQRYRAKRSSMDSGAAVQALQRRAVEVLAQRVDAVRRLLA